VMEVHTSRKYLMIRWKRQIPLIAVILFFSCRHRLSRLGF
jgi:hypothetical protein